MRRVLVVATIAVLAVTASAVGGLPGRWTPISKGRALPIDEAGLARTADGVLHVVWQRRGAATSALWHTRIASDGRTVDSEPITGGLVDADSPALAAAPDGSLRVFFFTRSADGSAANLVTATEPSGGGWTVEPDPLAHASGASMPQLGSATAHDGTPVTAWSTGNQVHVRIGVGGAPQGGTLAVGGCCATGVQTAVDQLSGQAYVGWASTVPGAKGIFVQAIDRAGPTRPKVFATGSATKARKAAVLPEGRVAIAARHDAQGVYVAYTHGYPQAKAIDMLRAGARTLVLDIKAPGAGDVALAAAPQGRLWLTWTREGKIYAARTNRAATRLGAVREIAPRRGAKAIDHLAGDASLGPLDLVASFETRGAAPFWHQQVLPGLSLGITAKTSTNAPTRYAFRVTDAGEPVANATVRVGRQSLTTGISGTVVLVTSDHPPTATASKPGYAPATAPIP